jgi:flagellar biosynthesis/type III secretory pathway chaperone
VECLEKEWQALVNSQEEAIWALAAQKEHILEKIIALNRDRDLADPGGEPEPLRRLKQQVAETQARNHRLITTALETIQDFLGLLQSAPPGIYHSAGRWKPPREAPFFIDRLKGLSQKTC